MRKLLIICGLTLVLGACGGGGGGSSGGGNINNPGVGNGQGAFASQVSAVIDNTNETDNPRQLNGVNYAFSDSNNNSQPVTVNN